MLYLKLLLQLSVLPLELIYLRVMLVHLTRELNAQVFVVLLGQFKSWLRAEGRAGDTSDYIQYLTMAPKSRKVAQLLRIEDNADLD